MKYEALLPYVLPFAKGCPQMVALHHIREAAIKFCDRALVWTAWLSVVSTAAVAVGDTITMDDGTVVTDTDGIVCTMSVDTAGQAFASNYLLPLPPQSDLVKLQAFFIDKQDGSTVSPDMGDSLRRRGSSKRVAWTTDMQSIEVNPVPTVQGTLYETRVALKPSIDSTGLPDYIGDNFARAIADGALSMLLDLPDESWSDQRRALEKAVSFEDDINRAARRAAKGFGRAKTNVRGFFR